METKIALIEGQTNSKDNSDQLLYLQNEHARQEEDILLLNKTLVGLEEKYELLEEQSSEKSSIIDELEKILDEQEQRDGDNKRIIVQLEEEVGKLQQREQEFELFREDFEKGEETLTALTDVSFSVSVNFLLQLAYIRYQRKYHFLSPRQLFDLYLGQDNALLVFLCICSQK